MSSWLRLSLRAAHAHLLWAWARARRGADLPLTDLPVLVFAPHPDDETIGCGGLIALKRQKKVPVSIVFVTDGGNCFGGVGPPKQEIVKVRHAEALAALEALGVPESDAYFLDLPDGGLSTFSEPTQKSVVRQIEEILKETEPGEILVTYRKDTHPDHEATFRLVQTALSRSTLSRAPTLIEYVVWRFWEASLLKPALWKSASGARILSVKTVIQRKRAAIQAYPSQFPVLPEGFLREHSRDIELYYIAPLN